MKESVNHKLIDLYSGCQSQEEHDQVRYRVFNPLTIFKSFQNTLSFSCVSSLPMVWDIPEGKDITKICKN